MSARLFALLLVLALPGAWAQSAPAEAALQRLEGRAGINPYDAVALNNLAVLRANEGDWIEALDLLERAHRFSPGHPAITRNLRDLRAWLDRRLPPDTSGGPGLEPAAVERLQPPPALWAP